MNQKTEQIRHLITHLLNKYGSENIIVTDYWDADNITIGLADKTKQFTIYITDKGNTDSTFYISLENPSTSDKLPYKLGENFENISADEVENILVKHLKISKH